MTPRKFGNSTLSVSPISLGCWPFGVDWWGHYTDDRALELCRANDSPMARIFAHVVRYWGQPAATIRQAVEADAAGEVVDLKRNVRVLNATSTIAPLLGLLGTVIGLIRMFMNVMAGGIGDPTKMAGGIGEALICTAFGLIVSIPAYVLHRYFRSKVSGYVVQMEKEATALLDDLSARSPAPRRRATDVQAPAQQVG